MVDLVVDLERRRVLISVHDLMSSNGDTKLYCSNVPTVVSSIR